jgi:hypothetical protein
MFSSNPLHEDELVQNEVDRYEKARIEKKLKDFILKKGVNSLNRVKTSEELLQEFQRDAGLESFKFNNEVASNKDSFDKFMKYDRLINYYKPGYRKSINEEMQRAPTLSPRETGSTTRRKQKMNGTPLFTLDIKINGDQKETLTYFASDDPHVISQKFCLKHNLPNDAKVKILKMIEERLQHI